MLRFDQMNWGVLQCFDGGGVEEHLRGLQKQSGSFQAGAHVVRVEQEDGSRAVPLYTPVCGPLQPLNPPRPPASPPRSPLPRLPSPHHVWPTSFSPLISLLRNFHRSTLSDLSSHRRISSQKVNAELAALACSQAKGPPPFYSPLAV